jgi:hypothetical protein
MVSIMPGGANEALLTGCDKILRKGCDMGSECELFGRTVYTRQLEVLNPLTLRPKLVISKEIIFWSISRACEIS